MADVVTISQAARAAGCSTGTLRNYVAPSSPFASHFSPQARPGPSLTRRFTPADIKLAAFIRAQSAAGEDHAAIADRLAAGDLQGFIWSATPNSMGEDAAPYQDAATDAHDAAEAAPLVVLRAGLQLMRLEVEDARRREDDLVERVIDAETRAAAAIARADALAAELQRVRLPWWRRLFGS